MAHFACYLQHVIVMERGGLAGKRTLKVHISLVAAPLVKYIFKCSFGSYIELNKYPLFDGQY
jgi:hypothetical protein